MSTMQKARAIGEKIQTEKQAIEALMVAQSQLRKAIPLVNDRSLFDRLTNPALTRALHQRIESQITRVGVLLKRPFSRELANQSGLAVVQSAQLLADLRQAVLESNRSQVQKLIDDLAGALNTILTTAVKALVNAIPPIPGMMVLLVVAGVYLLGNTRRHE